MARQLSSAGKDAEARSALSNSKARRTTIREAVHWLAEKEAEIKATREEINAYKQTHIKGDLGFKLADFNAVYRVSRLEVKDRDKLLDTLREGFEALDINQSLDWVAAAEANPGPKKRRANGNGQAAEPNDEARRMGREDGLGGVRDHAARYPEGEPGYGDYILGRADGEAERARVMALGEPVGGGATAH